MLIIGLTGGIGSGKSTVTTLFGKLGVPVVDADIVSRQVVEPGQPALTEITHQFGPSILTNEGQLDRQRLREVIFASAAKRRQLEKMLHPRILAEMKRQARQRATPYCIFAIPLLLEAGQQDEVERIVVVDATDDIRRQRIKKRDRLSDSEIDAILKTQLGRNERLAAADDIITNNGDLGALQQQVETLHRRYLNMAKTR